MYHQDEQLSTAFITNEKREIQNHYQYDAFGNGICQEEGISNRIRYTGQQYDGVTGQYYLRSRYYNPILGRFLQEDEYQGDGLNLYAYCGNNPVRYYDPSGYSKTPEVYNTGCPGATTNGDVGQRDNGAKSPKVLGGCFKNVDAGRANNEVGHHMPQNAYNVNELGLTRDEGPALLMTKEDHAMTRTYRGRGKRTMINDKGFTARQRMVLDIIDVRENFGTKI